MDLTERAQQIVSILKRRYPGDCSLNYRHDWQLLFAVRLSAQCTDARVNMVTPALFERFPTLESFACADVAQIAELIHSCGFFRTKANDLKNIAIILTEQYGGQLPQSIDELIRLPGIGRKTANIIMGDIYKQPAIAADTHCIRISNRLGLTDSRDPYKTEMQLKQIIAPSEQSDFCHRLVHFGRDICTARRPKCDQCPLRELCPSAAQQE